MKVIIWSTLLFFVFLVVNDSLGQSPAIEKNLEVAHTHFARGQYDRALSSIEEVLSKEPSTAEAYVLRGACREELSDLGKALTDYSIAIELSPENFDARLSRANVYFQLKRYTEARNDYLTLLKLPIGETNTIFFQRSASPTGTMQITSAQSEFHPLVFNYLGLTEFKLENYESAKTWLDSAIRLNPREADYYVNRGLTRQKLNDPRAREDFDKALQINPDHTAALSALASYSHTDGATSSEYLDKAIESDSTALYPYLERAYQRMQDGDFDRALQDYNHALTLEEKDAEIWLNRGFVREKLADLKGAYADYTQAISLKNDYAMAWLNRGNVLQKLGRLKEAVEDYSVAILYDPQYGAAYYNRAIVRQKLKLNPESCADVKKAEELKTKVDPKLKALVCR